MKRRGCLARRSCPGPRPAAAGLLQSGGLRAWPFPYVQLSRSFPPAMARDRPPAHFPHGRIVPRETLESSALPPTPLEARSTAALSFASATLPGVRPSRPAPDLKFLPPSSPSRYLLHFGLCWHTEYNRAILRPQIFLRHFLNLFASHGKESIQDGVHELRLVIEQREARQQGHQPLARHVAPPAALKRRVIIRAPFHFQLLQFILADALFLHFPNHSVEFRQRRFAGVFRLVQNPRGHLRGAVLAEDVVDAAIGFHGHLFFQHEFTMNSPGSAAVQRLVQQRHRVPFRRLPLRHYIADGHGWQ